jgi:hypothetical protein
MWVLEELNNNEWYQLYHVTYVNNDEVVASVAGTIEKAKARHGTSAAYEVPRFQIVKFDYLCDPLSRYSSRYDLEVVGPCTRTNR